MVFNKKKGMMVKSNMKNEASSMGMKKNIFAVKREEDDDDDFEDSDGSDFEMTVDETNISMDEDEDEGDDDDDDDEDEEDETEDMPTPGQKIQPHNNLSKKSAMANNKQVVNSAQNNIIQGKKNQAVLRKKPSNAALQGKKVVKGPSALIAQQDDDDDDNDDDEEDDDDDEEDDDDDEEEEGKKTIQKNIVSLKQDMQSKLPENKKKNNLTEEISESPKHSTGVLSEELFKKELERKNERDSRCLYMRGFATDTSAEEIKTLSSDILNVTFPWNKASKHAFCFLEFETEEKAVKNQKQLQGKKLNDREMFVDFTGTKSKKVQNEGPREVVKNKLQCESIPDGTNIVDVAQLFPKASSVTLSSLFDYRTAHATFLTDEDAAEAFEANENAKIHGESVVVVYPFASEQMKRKGLDVDPVSPDGGSFRRRGGRFRSRGGSFRSRGGPAEKRQRY